MQRPKTNEHKQSLTDDFAWAENAPEVQENPDHFGQLVAVHNRRILAVGRDRHDLIEQAAQNAGIPKSQLVVVLVARPGLWEIPH